MFLYLCPECIDRESCDTRVGHPKEFHVNRRSRKSSKKIVPIRLYMVCKYWSSRVRRSYRKLSVFAVQKTRKLGMWRSNVIHLRGYYDINNDSIVVYAHKVTRVRIKCAKYGAHGAHFWHTHAQSLRTQQWLIVDVIIASIVYRGRWWGGTLLCNDQSALTSGVATLSINTLCLCHGGIFIKPFPLPVWPT